jgi:MFS transporter, DHA1 family, multidrug resistance protein
MAARNPWLITGSVLFYAFGANWIFGLYFPESMEILPHIKGVAASLLTSLRLFIGALVVGLASRLYNATVFPLVSVIFACVAIILPLLFFYEKRIRLNKRIFENPKSANDNLI